MKQTTLNNQIVVALSDFDGIDFFEASLAECPDLVEYGETARQARENLVHCFSQRQHLYVLNVAAA